MAVNVKRIVKRTPSSRQRGKTDWARVDAMSDREIENAAKADPDAAPILDKNWFKQAKVVLPERKVPISLRMDRGGRGMVQGPRQTLSVADERGPQGVRAGAPKGGIDPRWPASPVSIPGPRHALTSCARR